MPDGKKSSWGGEGDFRTRGIRVRVYVCADVYAEMRLPYMSRAFFLATYLLFFSLSTQIKKNPKLFIPHVFFFIKKFIY